ncbi:MAG: fatty acid desaturase, partial [Planctomycetaceae bacterium]|nr:fatty acid desaturase [Planctomycetaceae bacterium]
MSYTMTSPPAEAPAFSLTAARGLVRDLFTPREWIYWTDFLTTVLIGHVLFGVTRALYDIHLTPLWLRLAIQLVTFSLTCICYYRAVMFVHELVHLPEKKFRAFRIVWNLLCGIPFLVPSFIYYPHLDHHRRRMFGTEHDGEYLPLARMSPWCILLYLSQCLWVPPLAVIRFGLLTPLTWLSPPLRRLIHQRASSLVMDPTYLRPLPTAAAQRIIFLQELACFLFIAGCAIVPPLLGRSHIPLVIQAYATSVVLVLLNAVRTLASHRWWSSGEPGTFTDQMLDSVTMDNDSPLAVLINPVGLRYHATHHLFPSMPYHNVRAAHQRLLAILPADSPYRRTVEHSIWPVIANLWRRPDLGCISEAQC